MILAMRTDKPEAELYLISNNKTVAELRWQAHRELSNTIFHQLEALFSQADTTYQELSEVIVFKGPGSFTGLRIGATVANTLAYSLHIPVIGTDGDNWIEDGINQLANGNDEKIVIPEYGGEANITKPRK